MDFRLGTDDRGAFDEVVVGNVFHAEMMTDRHLWMRVGDASINILLNEKGEAVSMRIERGEYGPELSEVPPKGWASKAKRKAKSKKA